MTDAERNHRDVRADLQRAEANEDWERAEELIDELRACGIPVEAVAIPPKLPGTNITTNNCHGGDDDDGEYLETWATYELEVMD